MDDFGAVDILLVEDSDPDAEMTTRALRKGGLVNRLVRVRDGVEALEFVFREGPWSARDNTQPKLTSSAEEQDIAESYHLGVNSYLVKPVEFPAFVELVAQLGMYWAVMNRLPA